jgi:HemY protein
MLAAAPPKRVEVAHKVLVEPPHEILAEPPAAPITPAPPAAQDNSPPVAADEPIPTAAPAPAAPKPESPPVTAAPLFRARQDIPKTSPPGIPAVIPIVRPPDDPGIDDEGPSDEFAEQIAPPTAQTGGWRGFLSRWGS